jgi:hypothetical protein
MALWPEASLSMRDKVSKGGENGDQINADNQF